MRLVCVLLLWLFSITATLPAETYKAPPPNIVLILCDDLGYSDIGCYGGEINTPNLDWLAKSGMRFSQFYNNAKCNTTRASLLTGLYPRRQGGLLKENMVTIAEALRGGGYRTALSGKWHLGHEAPNRPGDRGFQRYFGLLDGCCNYFDPSIPDPAFKGGKVRFVAEDDQRITEFPADFYMTDKISDYAVQRIDEFCKTDEPFFLHVCYTAPHYPLHALPEDIAKYRGKYKDGWENLRQARHQRQIEMGLIDPAWKLPGPEPEVKPWESRDQDWEDLRMSTYAAMVDRMDQGIGRILESLKSRDRLRNTVVMFLADNGGCAEIPGGEQLQAGFGSETVYGHCGPGWAYAQNTPFRRYKTWMHEGGISTPLVVYWHDEIQPGSITHQVGHINDLLLTCTEIAGIDYPKSRKTIPVLPSEGRSLVPAFHGQSRQYAEYIFWEWSGNRAVRHGDWKLAWDSKVKRWELYDLATDRTETTDLALKHPDKVEELAARWQTWAEETGVVKRK